MPLGLVGAWLYLRPASHLTERQAARSRLAVLLIPSLGASRACVLFVRRASSPCRPRQGGTAPGGCIRPARALAPDRRRQSRDQPIRPRSSATRHLGRSCASPEVVGSNPAPANRKARKRAFLSSCVAAGWIARSPGAGSRQSSFNFRPPLPRWGTRLAPRSPVSSGRGVAIVACDQHEYQHAPAL
jgi:hypothetical protein